MLRQAASEITVQTPSRGLHPITEQVTAWLKPHGIEVGLLTLFCRHTSASLLVQENAAPAARRDIERFFARIAPERANYEHDDEGADDMPAHLRAALTQTQLTIPIAKRQLALGTWQGIYLFEHRRAAHDRQIALHVIGE